MEPDIDPTELAEDAAQGLVQRLSGLGREVLAWLQDAGSELLQPYNFWQAVLCLVLFGVAHVLAGLLRPRVEAWTHSREGWPRWRLRYLVVLQKRLRLIVFVVLIWLALIVLRGAMMDARTALTEIVANLAAAWLVVALAARLIQNPILRSVVRYAAWTWVTLRILGLTDEAAEILDGIALGVGDVRLTALKAVQAVVTLAFAIVAARLVARSAAHRVEENPNISPSVRVLAIKLLQIGLYGAAFVFALRAVGVDLTGLAFLSGAVGVGLGFGLQKVVSNLVSGLIILLDKSIKPGDVISLGETFGWITTLGARYASVVTRDGREYLIPNEDLITTQVVNWTHSDTSVRLDINFGTAYGDDPHLVRRVAIEATAAVERVLGTPKPVCHITGFGDSSVDYILRFWIDDATKGLTNIRGNVFLALWDAFKENGITIPFPQREVTVLDGSRLRTAPIPD
ncbi:mechanosensitive ion channel family protein [Pseudoroseicyclus aestuarii]|uniref:Mechanosensitive ion channel-like protein n=1 Tax=Pseudoroseicyclus aestuarii TaxID=1795041 RepID=A0A318T2U9_9RHOB|nr:mechanosensitive ion channel domain-containing protein [Pseudoroseicyclus aestuarii]PYE84544.1 mechanosensitive ion channel-like protein [Pseudoroseicyclus aestuarii]